MSPKKPAKQVFDASAVLALLQGEVGSEKLRQIQSEAAVNSVNVAEVLAKLVSYGMPAIEAQAVFEALHLEVTPFEPAMAQLSARYVHKGISLGDRCFLAASHMHGSGWTSDRDLRTLLGKIVPHLNYFR